MVINRVHDIPLVVNMETLKNIELSFFDFHRCFLNDMDISSSNLYNCDFRSAQIIRTIINDSVLKGSKLIMLKSEDSEFVNTQFFNSYIFYSDFKKVNFEKADFTGAIMNNNNFFDCNFCNAVMDCKGIETCNLKGSVYNEYTLWHEGIEPEQLGAELVK